MLHCVVQSHSSTALCIENSDRLIKTADPALFENWSMDYMGSVFHTVSKSANNRTRACKDITHTCSLYDLSLKLDDGTL